MQTTLWLVALLALTSVFGFAQAPTATVQPNTVYTGADGKFETAPDTALIQFNINAQADNAKDAYAQAQKQAEQVRQIMRSNGIDPKSAEVGFYSIQPMYDWKNPKSKVVGYRVSTSVTLKLKDFTKIGPMTQQLADAAVSDSQSVSYTLENIDEAKGKAVEDAYRRAHANAEALARAGRGAHTRRSVVCVGGYLRECASDAHACAACDGHEGRGRAGSHRAVLAAERQRDSARQRPLQSQVEIRISEGRFARKRAGSNAPGPFP